MMLTAGHYFLRLNEMKVNKPFLLLVIVAFASGLQVAQEDVTSSEEITQDDSTTTINPATYEADENASTAEDGTTDKSETEVDAVSSLFDEYWEQLMESDPEFATSVGDHRYNDRLNRYSLRAYSDRKVSKARFLQRARNLLATLNENGATSDNLQLFIYDLQYDLGQLMVGSYLFPVSFLDGPQSNLQFLLNYTPLNSSEDYWNLLSRYRAFPQQVDDVIELMREGIRTNMTLNEHSLRNIDKQFSGLQVPAEDSDFYQPFKNISIFVPSEEREILKNNASAVVSEILLPAFQRLANFVKQEYRQHLRPEIGVTSLPKGSQYYQQQLKFHLTADVTPQEVHNLGLTEVSRISQDMQEVIHSLGLNLTQREFCNKLRDDPKFLFATREEALKGYRDLIFNVITPKIPLIFKNIPKMQLRVEQVPDSLLGGPRAYYLSGSPDGSTPGTFYVDTSSLKSIPKYDMVTLALHEGVPGHHLQISYAMEQKGIPKFRKHVQYPKNTAYIEGWGLYSEFLGYELGLYEERHTLFGHLSEEIFRACRLVVDTGMHALGWSRQQAIDYMLHNSASAQNNIEVEVDRYITWPGQACSYKFGELKIKELRKAAEEALDSRFDVKEFHDIILRSSGPLAFVEKQVGQFINTKVE